MSKCWTATAGDELVPLKDSESHQILFNLYPIALLQPRARCIGRNRSTGFALALDWESVVGSVESNPLNRGAA